MTGPRQGAGDVHRLDRDGVACESLPGVEGVRVCEDGSVERAGFAVP